LNIEFRVQNRESFVNILMTTKSSQKPKRWIESKFSERVKRQKTDPLQKASYVELQRVFDDDVAWLQLWAKKGCYLKLAKHLDAYQGSLDCLTSLHKGIEHGQSPISLHVKTTSMPVLTKEWVPQLCTMIGNQVPTDKTWTGIFRGIVQCLHECRTGETASQLARTKAKEASKLSHKTQLTDLCSMHRVVATLTPNESSIPMLSFLAKLYESLNGAHFLIVPSAIQSRNIVYLEKERCHELKMKTLSSDKRRLRERQVMPNHWTPQSVFLNENNEVISAAQHSPVAKHSSFSDAAITFSYQVDVSGSFKRSKLYESQCYSILERKLINTLASLIHSYMDWP
jgi:hypothetical protein